LKAKQPPRSLADRVWYLYHCLPRDEHGSPPSFRELEKAAGLSASTMSRTVNGVRRHHGHETFARIAKVLGVSPDLLRTGVGEWPAPTGNIPPVGYMTTRKRKTNGEQKERRDWFNGLEGGPMRAETGTIKFGDDWRGVFIRGDDAFGYAVHLRRLLSLGSTPRIAAQILKGVIDLLESADERRRDDGVQRLKAFEECKAGD